MALQANPLGYKLCVLDTVGRALQGIDENKMENATALTQMIEYLIRYLDCTVLAVHHTGHGDQNRPRGSSVFGADTDTMLKLTPVGERIAALELTKQKDGEVWEKPRHIKFTKHLFDKDSSTLVAERPHPLDIPKPTAPQSKHASSISTGASIGDPVNELIATYIEKRCTTYSGASWSMNEMAKWLSAQEGVGVKWRAVTRRLHDMVSDDMQPVKKHYDADKARWVARKDTD